MLARVRRFLDVRPGEALPVALTFVYIAAVVAAFLLAKSIRNGLFLKQYGPFALAYAYAAVPIALSLFVPLHARIAARVGQRTVTVGTLVFFGLNVLLFWWGFRFHPDRSLPAIFYVWVNCFGIIAPVQAWSFANSLFDTRQARRLFGLVGSGASLGAILGGLLARVLVGPVGGAANLLLVLALLIFGSAGIVVVANARLRRRGLARRGRPSSTAFRTTLAEIGRSRYLRLMAAMVFLVAIATQWTGFQLSLVVDHRFNGNAEAITSFFGSFNFALGIVSFALQLLLTGPVLARFGVGLTILLLPAALGLGSAAILIAPALWPVLITNACDQGLRFSVDKATYELLYLPISPGARARVKNAIDIVVNRFGDAAGGILLGLATRGFFGLPGLRLGLRGTAAINLALIAGWCAAAWQLRRAYVGTIRDSIHQHRLASEQQTQHTFDRSAAEALASKLAAEETGDVLDALAAIGEQRIDRWRASLRPLLQHPEAEVRRRALALLRDIGDRAIAPAAGDLLRDPDPGVRTEALLFLAREMGIDPVARIQELGDFEDFSIRAGMAAFLASAGPSRNLEASRAILEQMAAASGPDGARERIEAARVLALADEGCDDLLCRLIRDDDAGVARQAIATARTRLSPGVVDALIDALGHPEAGDEAADALARYGNDVVPALEARLLDETTLAATRREIPIALVRIGSGQAAQALVDALLQGDASVRHRVIAGLNKLRRVHPNVPVDRGLVDLLLAAEISGHYRSYQVLAALMASVEGEEGMVRELERSMAQELERIFRLMSLLYPDADLQDAYVGLQSANSTIRANALEFLDNVLPPSLRHLLLPLLDAHVTVAERAARANRLIGAPLTSAEQAVDTLLASEDVWLRASAAQAVGTLRLHGLGARVSRLAGSRDTVVQEAAASALRQLTGDREPAPESAEPPAQMGIGVG
ncbi:MAG TPA: Npt1/Npt2 family nucleotide transporter [Vicinamibacterales bacterium]|nr:Npt1/Npt2 family nucleotide transporter [Vicinamibacterales bacterium]